MSESMSDRAKLAVIHDAINGLRQSVEYSAFHTEESKKRQLDRIAQARAFLDELVNARMRGTA